MENVAIFVHPRSGTFPSTTFQVEKATGCNVVHAMSCFLCDGMCVACALHEQGSFFSQISFPVLGKWDKRDMAQDIMHFQVRDFGS